jgi:hypothetical protein
MPDPENITGEVWKWHQTLYNDDQIKSLPDTGILQHHIYKAG